MSENRIEKLAVLAQTKFLNLYDATYKNKKGKEKHWIIASRKKYEDLKAGYFAEKKEKIDAVVVVALHEEAKQLVVIRQFRVPLNDYVYELPAGLIDADEEIESALERELKEETGLELLEVREKLSRDKVYLSAGMTDESSALIYCTCRGSISKEYLEDDEDIEAFLITREEAKALLESDAKMDVKAYMVLQGFVKLGEKLFEE